MKYLHTRLKVTASKAGRAAEKTISSPKKEANISRHARRYCVVQAISLLRERDVED
jgi:hypothetical protein